MTQSVSNDSFKKNDSNSFNQKDYSRIGKRITDKLSPNTKELLFEFGNFYTHVYSGSKKIISLPTCYLQNELSLELVVVGERAFSMIGKSPSGMRVIFPIKKGAIYDLDQFEQFLRFLLTTIKKQESWGWLTRIKATCVLPERCTQFDAQLYIQSLAQVGITNVIIQSKSNYLLKKITGCADQSKTKIDAREGQIAILDIGDQLTELIIGSYGKNLFEKSLDFGGALLTQAILDHLYAHHELKISYQQAIEIKHKLPVAEKLLAHKSGQTQSDLGAINIRGVDLSEGLIVTKKVQLHSIVEDVYQQLPLLLHQLKKALITVKSQQSLSALENGMILTGEGSLLSGLRDYLSDELGINAYLLSRS